MNDYVKIQFLRERINYNRRHTRFTGMNFDLWRRLNENINTTSALRNEQSNDRNPLFPFKHRMLNRDRIRSSNTRAKKSHHKPILAHIRHAYTSTPHTSLHWIWNVTIKFDTQHIQYRKYIWFKYRLQMLFPFVCDLYVYDIL